MLKHAPCWAQWQPWKLHTVGLSSLRSKVSLVVATFTLPYLTKSQEQQKAVFQKFTVTQIIADLETIKSDCIKMLPLYSLYIKTIIKCKRKSNFLPFLKMCNHIPTKQKRKNVILSSLLYFWLGKLWNLEKSNHIAVIRIIQYKQSTLSYEQPRSKTSCTVHLLLQ